MSHPSPRQHPPERLSGVPDTPLIELSPQRPWLTLEEINRLIRQQGLAPALAKAFVLDEVIAQLPLEPDQEDQLISAFCQKQKLNGDEELGAWLQQRRLSREDLRTIATAEERLHQWRQRCWGDQVETHFLERKLELDQVVYSLLRVSEPELAEELHQRLKGQEADFPELAQFSKGPEKTNQGRIGPLPLAAAHELVASRLRVSQPGQLWPPFQAGDVWVVLRLEQWLPAQLDEAMQAKMVDELFQRWLQQRVKLLLAGEPLPPLPVLPPRDVESANATPA